MWPAFWMLGTDIDAVGWRACGEIEVMEYVGSRPTTVHGTAHGPPAAQLAVGGEWPGNATDDPSLPATMLVDRVRIHG